MDQTVLAQIAVFLAAAAIAAPLGRMLRVSSILGYLAAGALIGPFGIGLIHSLYEAENILHFSEFGIVLLLFVIGLELRPTRLWGLRSAIAGAGGAQVLITAALITAAGMAFSLPFAQALFVGFALSLSSTAFALQVLEERKELSTRHGRLGFSILLFQDLAAIPLIAFVPLFAIGQATAAGEPAMTLSGAALGLGIIVGVVLAGRFVLNRLYRLVAASGVREAMTASALLTVVGVAMLMEIAGLSAALGAFIAGALLADSEYRHQIEADIAPFEGLLLGLFFVAIGMSLDLGLIASEPMTLLGIVAGLFFIKTAVLYWLARWQGLKDQAARRLALVLWQGGEFAFVLFTAGIMSNVIGRELADLLTVAVTLSMAATPLLMLLQDFVHARSFTAAAPAYDTPPEEAAHVIIAGFGRFGQIVARVLRARGLPFTALDVSADQVDFVKRFGAKIYYGDASRLDILRAAQAEKARAFVLAIDDVNASVATAEVVRRYFPDLPIYARARNRQHVHALMDLGVKIIRRETFLSAIDLTREVLRGMGEPEAEVRRLLDTFQRHDEAQLIEGYQDRSDAEKQQLRAQSAAKELEALFQQDAEEQPTPEPKPLRAAE